MPVLDNAKTVASREPDAAKEEAQNNAAKRRELLASKDAIQKMGLGQAAQPAALADIEGKLAQLPEAIWGGIDGDRRACCGAPLL